MKEDSIFRQYYKDVKFIDRKTTSNEEAIDVIIPLLNTNELFERNLYSFYKEISINRLIIGDAGCTDNSIEIVKKFPRVKIVNQSSYLSLGYCIAELISLVETDWFIYLHSDVYLPENWLENMEKYKNTFDWFECDRKITTILKFNIPTLNETERAFSGAQMGRKQAFKNIIPKIKDDYLYRNEDLIFHELILSEGYKYGRIFDTFHYHQIMSKKGEKEGAIKSVDIIREKNIESEKNTYMMQVKGIIKYLQPKPYLIKSVNDPLNILKSWDALNIKKFKKWVRQNNIKWLKYLDLKEKEPPPTIIQKIYYKLRKKLYPLIKKLF